MKTYLCEIMVPLFLYCLAIIEVPKPNNALLHENNFKCYPADISKVDAGFDMNNLIRCSSINHLLSIDYKLLSNFSKQLKSNDVTAESFERLFWKGVNESLHLYNTSVYKRRSSIHRTIKTSLKLNADMRHHLKRPELVNTNELKAIKALNEFAGEWHGKWQAMNVHHFWLPVRQPINKSVNEFAILGFQSCFTGDGFGWNYIVKAKGETMILGFVHHFDNEKASANNSPHYALLNSNNQLTWITENHIYYEFICTDASCAGYKHYVITGAAYEEHASQTTLTTRFQAIYLPENQQLPAFQQSEIDELNTTNSSLSTNVKSILKNLFKPTTIFRLVRKALMLPQH